MALPNDTTMEELALVFELGPTALSDSARKLTKGDLMRLNGSENDVSSIRQYAIRGPQTIEGAQRNAAAAGLELTVEDLQSIHAVFGSPRVPRDYLLVAGARVTESINVSVYACCCPCCCAT